MTIFLSG